MCIRLALKFEPCHFVAPQHPDQSCNIASLVDKSEMVCFFIEAIKLMQKPVGVTLPPHLGNRIAMLSKRYLANLTAQHLEPRSCDSYGVCERQVHGIHMSL